MILLKDLIRITKGKLIQGDPNTKINNFSIDTRILKKGDVFLAIKGENFDGHDFLAEAVKRKAKGIIVSRFPIWGASWAAQFPKERIFILKVKDVLAGLQKTAEFYRRKFKGKVIAITGSNGKTTVKEMTAKVLENKFRVLKAPQSFNNQIGVPLALLNGQFLQSPPQIVVLELGTNHFGEIKKLTKICQPHIGIITNIGKAHIGYFGSRENIFEEKKGLIKSPNLGKLILNADDFYLNKIRFRDKITFGIKNPADFRGKILKINPEFTLFEIEKIKIKLPLPGVFNAYNALAAIATGRIFGINFGKIKKTLENYKTLSLRSEIFKIKKARILQDCYNSNPTSIIESLKVLEKFSGKKIVVFGDMLELGKFAQKEHQKIGKYLNNSKPYLVICVGDLTKFAFREIKNKNIKKFWVKSSLDVVPILQPLISQSFTILIKGSRKMELEKITKELKS